MMSSFSKDSENNIVHSTDASSWILLHRADFELVKSCETFEEVIEKISSTKDEASDAKFDDSSKLSSNLKVRKVDSTLHGAKSDTLNATNAEVSALSKSPSIAEGSLKEAPTVILQRSRVLQPFSVVMENPVLATFQRDDEERAAAVGKIRQKRPCELTVECIQQLRKMRSQLASQKKCIRGFFSGCASVFLQSMSSLDLQFNVDFQCRNVAGEEVVCEHQAVLNFGTHLWHSSMEGRLRFTGRDWIDATSPDCFSNPTGNMLYGVLQEVAWNRFYGKLEYTLLTARTSPLTGVEFPLVWRSPYLRADITEAEFFSNPEVSDRAGRDVLVGKVEQFNDLLFQVCLKRSPEDCSLPKSSSLVISVSVGRMLAGGREEVIDAIAEIWAAFESIGVDTCFSRDCLRRLQGHEVMQWDRRIADAKAVMLAKHRPSRFKCQLVHLMTSAGANYEVVKFVKKDRLSFLLDHGADSFSLGEGVPAPSQSYRQRNPESEQSLTSQSDLAQCLELLQSISSKNYREYHCETVDRNGNCAPNGNADAVPDGDTNIKGHSGVHVINDTSADEPMAAKNPMDRMGESGTSTRRDERADALSNRIDSTDAPHIEELTIGDLERRKKPLVAHVIVVAPENVEDDRMQVE